MKGQRQAHSSVAKGDENARDDWRTPRLVLAKVRHLAELCWPGIAARPGAGIFLDPCGNADNSTGAAYVYSGPEGNGFDGLVESWGDASNDGLTYDNWPYSDSMAWATKMDAAAADGVPLVGLGPLRADTAWWRIGTRRCVAVGFWQGRMTFELPPHVEPYMVQGNGRDLLEGVADLSGLEGVLKVVAQPNKRTPAKGYLYVEVLAGAAAQLNAEYGIGLVPFKVSPAPFPSALLFYNVPVEHVVTAFGDKVDIYMQINPSSIVG